MPENKTALTRLREAHDGPRDEAIAGVVENHLAQLRADLAQSARGTRLTGAMVRPLSEGPRLSANAGALVGWGLWETTGAADAFVVLRNGVDASADPIVGIHLTAGDSRTEYYGAGGLTFTDGLFLHLVRGAVDGAVYTAGAGAS